MLEPITRTAVISGGRGHSTMKAGIVRRTLVVIALCISGGARSSEETIPIVFGTSGGTEARPLSREWLDYWGSKYPYDDSVGSRLVAELVRSEGANSDSWSTRTESEIRTAIRSDDRLSKNTWNTVRCSRNGCIVAIDPVDFVNKSLTVTFRSRLLSSMTPRRNLSHRDFLMIETDAIHGKGIAYTHLLFFLFPEVMDHASDEARPQRVSQPSK